MRKLTPEEREQYITSYWGQEVLCNDEMKSENVIINLRTLSVGFLENDYLLLTPVSQITDEHAVLVARKNPYCSPDMPAERMEVFVNSFGRTVVKFGKGFKDCQLIDYEVFTIEQRDILIRNGYALPFTTADGYTFSVQELIDQGVLKLKE